MRFSWRKGVSSRGLKQRHWEALGDNLELATRHDKHILRLAGQRAQAQQFLLRLCRGLPAENARVRAELAPSSCRQEEGFSGWQIAGSGRNDAGERTRSHQPCSWLINTAPILQTDTVGRWRLGKIDRHSEGRRAHAGTFSSCARLGASSAAAAAAIASSSAIDSQRGAMGGPHLRDDAGIFCGASEADQIEAENIISTWQNVEFKSGRLNFGRHENSSGGRVSLRRRGGKVALLRLQ